ncbi:hypothetical protein M3Y99_01016600 [Aphelenchoides fujianensis]|nr:hypothetical protein M3Y99_01016600 [Aphelenchoides fujianensis]
MKIVNSFRRSRRKNQEPPRRNVVLIGDGGCGKTCLVMTFKSGVFPLGKYIPTIFEAYAVASSLASATTRDKEGYERLRALSYGNADCVLLCFAVDSADSLENAKKWAREVRNFRPTVPIVLVANKTDLRDDATLQPPAIPTVRGEEVAQQVGARAYVECSAKN